MKVEIVFEGYAFYVKVLWVKDFKSLKTSLNYFLKLQKFIFEKCPKVGQLFITKQCIQSFFGKEQVKLMTKRELRLMTWGGGKNGIMGEQSR